MITSIILPAIPLTPRGGYKIIFSYADYLVSKGDTVRLIYLTDRSLRDRIKNEVVRDTLLKVISKRTPNWYPLDRRIEVMTAKSFDDFPDGDIIVATAIRTAEFVVGAAKRCGRKVYLIQDYESWAASEETLAASYSSGMANIVVSKWLKELVEGISGTDTYYVTNPIDTATFSCNTAARIPQSITLHYRSGEYKGPTYSIEILERLRERYPNLTATVISSERRPVTMPRFVRYIHNATPSTVSTVNNTSQVFLCTSINEGFGLPGLEAMACGCALVSFDYLGVHEYARDGENAVIVPSRDVEAAVDAISRLFGDDEFRERLSKQAMEDAAQRSVERAGEKFRQVLLNLV